MGKRSLEEIEAVPRIDGSLKRSRQSLPTIRADGQLLAPQFRRVDDDDGVDLGERTVTKSGRRK